jgi:hypothetical protein
MLASSPNLYESFGLVEQFGTSKRPKPS